ncbi:MAG TPA: AraC family transcriptional regulator [Chthoniobacter sp.]|nr:AraC family transcriptional regulator [Chthoniobacter sp.]
MPSKRIRGGYQSPFTRHGIRLGDAPRLGFTTFTIHESGYLPHGSDWNHPGVLSPFWRLYRNGAPGCHVRFGRETFPLQPDCLLLIPDNTPFDCVCETRAPHLWLHFSPLQTTGAFPRRPVALPVSPPLRALVENLIAARTAADSPLTRQHLYHHAAALLHSTFAGLEIPIAPEAPERLDNILRFLHSQLAGDLSNAVLARRAVMGESVFIRWFKQHTGITPAIYVQQARGNHAAQLLALTDRTIEQIAADCGFPNRYYFTRVFRRHLGCGPAEYRKRQVRAG